MEYENGATGVFVTTTGDVHGTNRFAIQMDTAKIVVTLPIDENLYYEELMKRVAPPATRLSPLKQRKSLI